MKNFKKIAIVATITSVCAFMQAKEHEVKMLDIDSAGNTMVFEPAYIHIEPGDTVTFLPTHKSHWAESKVVPDGATKFLSKLDEKASFTFDKEGIYLYVCPPHQMMNMVGIIQVGKATNIDKVKDVLPKLEKRAMSNKGRWAEYAKSIKE